MKLNRYQIILLPIILLSLCKFSMAAESIPTQKSSIILSGNVLSQYRPGESFDLWYTSLSTSNGYFVINNLSLHLLFGLSYIRALIPDSDDTSELDFFIGGESRYYFNESNPHIFASIAITHHEDDDYFRPSSHQQYQFSLGCNLFITKHVSIEPSLFYMRQDADYKYIGIKAGIGTFLFE